METIHGIAVFPGVAIGPALVLDPEGLPVAQPLISAAEIPAEIGRLDRCLEQIGAELAQSATVVRDRLGPEVAMIFEAHRRMVLDRHLRQAVVEQIEHDSSSAEAAVRRVLRKYADFFRSMNQSHFADRASDMQDIERRILACLVGGRRCGLDCLDRQVIILAHDLTPSETAGFNPRFVQAMATETGGRTSHTAIIAGALEIPAVVGLGSFLAQVADRDVVILDGNAGTLIVRPDERTLEQYRTSARSFLQFVESLGELRDLPAETRDGTRIQLLGNIEFPHEAGHCLERGADGIGLYRTEFLYLNRDEPPTEDEHFAAYAAVLKAMGPDRPVTFRTMDLGADKLHRSETAPPEYNPFLGLRSIRLSLRNLPMFKTQLRALLRASVLGNVRIMFPLVSTIMELRRCRMILADVMEDLEEEGIDFRRDIPIGMMVEVPSAAVLADQFARYVDFFSIGTNDLIQYTLAVDRTNETVAPLYSASDPAVLRLVRGIVRAAERHGVEVNVCGEMSGDPVYTQLLLGLGLRRLSVTPHNIPEIKKIIRGVTLGAARKVAGRVWRLDTASAITNYLRNRARRVIPELIDDLS